VWRFIGTANQFQLLFESPNVSINAGDTGEKLLVALLGDYGYALYLDGRASSMLPADFATAHPEVGN
jgi:hypothetical protein